MQLHPYNVTLIDGRIIERRAWTGGRESSYPRTSPLYRLWLALSADMFVEQVDMWRAYWGDEPNDDTLGIYWNRAKGDAYATISEAAWGGFQFFSEQQEENADGE